MDFNVRGRDFSISEHARGIFVVHGSSTNDPEHISMCEG